MRFDLAASATLALIDDDESVARRVRAAVDPYVPAGVVETDADVVLEVAADGGRRF